MHSGTTLLYKILGNHEDLFAFPGETRLMENLLLYERQLRDCKSQNDKFEFRNFFVDTLKLSPADSAACNREVPEYDFEAVPSLFQNIAEDLCEVYGKSGWVEKTPTNVYFIEDIFKKFPLSKIILIYRDFRDVLASKKTRTLTVNSGRYHREEIEAKKLEKDWNVVADAISWNKSIDAQMKGVKNFPGNVCVVPYESLVTDPMKELRRVCDFIGINFADRILDIQFSNKAAFLSEVNKSGIYTNSVSVWASVLSKTEMKLATYLTGKRLTLLNYLPSVTRPAALFIIFGVLKALPGIAMRVYKRFKLLGWRQTIQFSKNYLHRF